MKCENIDIKVEGSSKARLTLYIQDDYPETYGERLRPIVVICPGGAYEYVSVREGEPVALNFLTVGCHAAVLWYDASREGAEFPLSLLELSKALSIIRDRADELKVDRDKIIIMGFSAGGHLAASLACFWNEKWLEDKMGICKDGYKPNGLILAYPVITSGKFAHRDSIKNLMGSNASDELNNMLSLENQVTSAVPPTFIWHTYEDASVPLENTLLFASALRKADVNFELHIFPHGGHGYSLATYETAKPPLLKEINPQCAQWMDLCKNWIKHNFATSVKEP